VKDDKLALVNGGGKLGEAEVCLISMLTELVNLVGEEFSK